MRNKPAMTQKYGDKDPSVVFGLFDSEGSRIADGKQAMVSEAIDKQFATKGL